MVAFIRYFPYREIMAHKVKPLDQTYGICGVQITTLLVGHLLSRLEVQAGKNGGALSGAEIRTCTEKFLAEEMPHFQSSFRRNYDECSVRRQQHQWSTVRKQPLVRILTRKFAHLFAPRMGDGGEQGLLSRRMMPGFTVAITKMIGPTLYKQCQHKAQAIVERHPTAFGSFDWQAIYADPECLALSADILVVMAHYFTEFDRRRNWFMALVNSHLAPVLSDEDFHPNWQLTNHGFAEMMRSLFADLAAELDTHPDRMLARYGEQTAQAISNFLQRLRLEA